MRDKRFNKQDFTAVVTSYVACSNRCVLRYDYSDHSVWYDEYTDNNSWTVYHDKDIYSFDYDAFLDWCGDNEYLSPNGLFYNGVYAEDDPNVEVELIIKYFEDVKKFVFV